MKLCSDTHEEICYDSNYCPFCDELVDLRDKINTLEQELEDVKNAT